MVTISEQEILDLHDKLGMDTLNSVADLPGVALTQFRSCIEILPEYGQLPARRRTYPDPQV